MTKSHEYASGTDIKWEAPYSYIEGFIVFNDLRTELNIDTKYLIANLEYYIFTTNILEFSSHDYLTAEDSKKCLSPNNRYFKALKMNDNCMKLIEEMSYNEVLEMSTGFIKIGDTFFQSHTAKLSFKRGLLHSFDDLPSAINTYANMAGCYDPNFKAKNYKEWHIDGVLQRYKK